MLSLALKKYYTIQHMDAWKQAQLKGVLTGNSDYAIKGYEHAYEWMIDQMATRLGYPKCYPIWVWTERPDLRQNRWSWSGEKGIPLILLQLTLQESEVLLSDYSGWISVLNNMPLDLHEEEPIEKQESWERLFNLEVMLKSMQSSPFYTKAHEKYIPRLQGVTPAINLNQIKEIKTFITGGQRKYRNFA